ncbi:MAG: Crp/Fnr family transcriptional regulator [Myxococcota bacterium]
MKKSKILNLIQKIFPNQEFCREFVKSAKIIKAKRNEVVYIPGDQSSEIYIVLEGVLLISRVTSTGKGFILDYLGKNDFFGGESFLGEQEGRWELVEAKKKSIILAVSFDKLHELLKVYPELYCQLVKILLNKRKKLASRLEILLYRQVKIRLTALLLDLSKNYGTKTKQGVLINITIPHHELARFIGSTRETVSATISELKKEKLIIARGRRFILPNPFLLEALL